MKSLCICLLTYNRFEYAERTILSALQGIKTEMDVSIHIADDGSPRGYVDQLEYSIDQYCRDAGINTPYTTVSNSEHHGYGANYNLATQYTHLHDYILPLEDDWELMRPLEVDPLLPYCIKNPYQASIVRLGYLSGTGVIRGEYVPEGMLLLDPESPEQHIFAGHPRLVTPEWEKRAGPWPEGLSPGETELTFCGRKESRMGVFWPMNVVKTYGDLFVHIGTIRSTDVPSSEIAHV